MNKKLLAIIGLIGGILAVVGVFGTWMSISMTVAGTTTTMSASGWELAQPIAIGTLQIGAKLPYLALVGCILAIVGSILVLVKPSIITKVLLATGGILALIGVAYGLVMIDVAAAIPGMAAAIPGIEVSMGAGYGAYLVIAGGILAILVTLGLKEK